MLIYKILHPTEIKTFNFLVLLIIVNAVFETIVTGIVALALRSILTKEPVPSLTWLNSDYLFIIGIFAVIISLASRLLTTFSYNRFAQSLRAQIGRRFFLSEIRNKGINLYILENEKTKKILLSEIDQLIGQYVIPLFNTINSTAILLTIALALTIIDPLLTVISLISVIVFMGLIYIRLKKKIDNDVIIRRQQNQNRFADVEEILINLRTVLLYGLQKSLVEQYYNHNLEFGRKIADNQIMSVFPRYIIESLIFLFILLFSVSYYASPGKAVSLWSIYAGVSAMRLLPALQSIYASKVKIDFGRAVASNFVCKVGVNENEHSDGTAILRDTQVRQLHIEDFNWTEDTKTPKKYVLKNDSINWIKGPSGIGKSTFVDRLLGLRSSKFTIRDQDAIDFKINFPQCSVYSQKPEIFNNTLLYNLTLGSGASEINMLNEKKRELLPHISLTTVVQKDQLSGGEQSRIQFLRTILKEADVYIFDEPFSNIDSKNLRLMVQEIEKKVGNSFVILISHQDVSFRAPINIIEIG